MHHFKNLEIHLKEFSRILKPKGILILKVDHFDPELTIKEIEQSSLFQRVRATSQLF